MRIVSLVPSQTELLVDLGLEEKLLGITKFCVHPKALRKTKSVVGGTKQVNFDRIQALQPDIIICNKEENTEEMVMKLATLAPVWVSDVATIEDTFDLIGELGKIFDVTDKAAQLNTEILAAYRDFKTFMQNHSHRKVLYLIWKDPYMAVGRDTFINELLALNKFENTLLSEDSRYPEIDRALLERPELVLLSTEPYPFKQKHVAQLQKELDNRVILVNGEYFSWYGSRLQRAFGYFKSLHQTLDS